MSKLIERVEIIIGRERRRRYTVEEKVRLVEQILKRCGVVMVCVNLTAMVPIGPKDNLSPSPTVTPHRS